MGGGRGSVPNAIHGMCHFRDKDGDRNPRRWGVGGRGAMPNRYVSYHQNDIGIKMAGVTFLRDFADFREK